MHAQCIAVGKVARELLRRQHRATHLVYGRRIQLGHHIRNVLPDVSKEAGLLKSAEIPVPNGAVVLLRWTAGHGVPDRLILWRREMKVGRPSGRRVAYGMHGMFL